MAVVNRFFIVGAGHFGRAIANEITGNSAIGKILAFIDDDPKKIGSRISGIPVLGPVSNCHWIAKSYPPAEALVALPSATYQQLDRVHEALLQADFKRIRIIPSMSQFVTGEPHFLQVRDMDPQDLLGREPILIDLEKSLAYVKGKRVLITGAGGSIGSELSRQLLYGMPERLYLLGHGENSIYRINHELSELQEAGVCRNVSVVPIIGELQDMNYMRFLLRSLKADVIFHCAAHKHVPMMELNPIEGMKNNVLGTKNLLDAAVESGTQRFVLISTDKAVHPSSVYGASKRIAEMLVLSSIRRMKDYIVVRFGNVLGSRGSIMPLFKKQIIAGGPVTVTTPDAKRWFMTIPEAVSLVLKTGELAREGGLYMLDMGKPVRILDFARQMIKFYGYDEASIPVKFIGLRAGEKKTERLWADFEKPILTEHPRIVRLNFPQNHDSGIDEICAALAPVFTFQSDQAELFRNRRALRAIVKEFFPDVVEHKDEPKY